MCKLISIFIIWILSLFSLFNTCNAEALITKTKINQIKIDNKKANWLFLKMVLSVEFDKLDQNGLPVNLELKNGIKNITFFINKSENQKLKYRVKLDGYNKNWKYLEKTSIISFRDLKQGDFCFTLQEISGNVVTHQEKFKFYNNLSFFPLVGDIPLIFLTLILLILAIKLK